LGKYSLKAEPKVTQSYYRSVAEPVVNITSCGSNYFPYCFWKNWFDNSLV